ncbi:hypothetical protein MMC11_008284 [Xylographa trunciseda]|nr:hypothetical protein [Xylographa trunciseda]
MAANQASAQPSRNSLQVRMLVIYSRWVQIFTAKTTQRYVYSVIEGRNEIADQMKIYQTPWFNFTDVSGQQQILRFALEWVILQIPGTKKQRVPLEDVQSSTQNSKSPKRKLDAGGEQSNKRQKREHKRDGTKETSALV